MSGSPADQGMAQASVKALQGLKADGPSLDNSRLRMPVMGDPLKYINPVYTKAGSTDSLSPLAAFQAFKQTGAMPQQQGGWTPFVAPKMQSVVVDTSYKPAGPAGLIGSAMESGANGAGDGGGYGAGADIGSSGDGFGAADGGGDGGGSK